MKSLKKFINKKLLKYMLLLIFGVLLAFFSKRPPISTAEAGFYIILVSIFGILYESRLWYYIKFNKDKKSFKSDKEKFIADYFSKKNIKYVYERELKLDSKKLHPDFFLPEFDVYVEYWGKWDTDFEYRKECAEKRKTYEENGIPLVELYPDNLKNINQLDWKFTDRLLKLLKKDRSL